MQLPKLLQLRKSKSLTQQGVANELGISRQAYANYEAGNREPDINTLKSLSKLYGVSIDYILDNEIVKTDTETDSSDEYTGEEKALVNAFRKADYENRFKIIQYALNITDMMEKKSLETNSRA